MKTKTLVPALFSLFIGLNILGQVNPPNDMVAYYPFNGNALDESVYSNQAVVQGATLYADRFNTAASAYLFNGTDGNIEIPNNPQINYGEYSSFTINVWFKIINNGDHVYDLITKGNGYQHLFEIDIINSENAYVRFLLTIGSTTAALYDSNYQIGITDNAWHMVTVTVNRTTRNLQLYQDGVLISEMIFNSIRNQDISSDAPLQIGGNSRYFSGLIDDLRIYKRVLSINEIQALYDLQIPHITTPDTVIQKNKVVNVPIIAENLPVENNIIAYEFDLNYDTKKLAYTGYSLVETIALNGLVQVNPEPGTLHVSWAGMEALSESGSLLNLQFTTLDTGYCIPQISNMLFNTSPVTSIETGTISIQPPYGDVDGNNNIQAYDAALALQYSVGQDPLPLIDPLPWLPWRYKSANVDGYGGISAYDASLILRFSVGIIDQFPVESITDKYHNQEIANVQVTLEDEHLVFQATGELFGLNIQMNPMVEALGNPEIMTTSALYTMQYGEKGFLLALASAEAIDTESVFLRIPVEDINIQPLQVDMLVNGQARQVVVQVPNKVENIQSQPIRYYPNPNQGSFNIELDRVYNEFEIAIYSPDGCLLYQDSRTGKQTQIDLPGQAGIYIISLSIDGTEQYFRVMKQ